ncbi:MAG: polysaccharide pyruvyl transferase family protein [Bacteroidales bacterium]|nr:polysaccharide pyruvyl transferase family protein [Bacteroidales bacterium]
MKKVLILTQPLRTNYGGLLQAFALQKVVKDLGFEVLTDNPFYLGRLSLRKKIKDFAARFVYGVLRGDKKYKPLFKHRLKRKDYEYAAQNILPFIETRIATIDFFKGKAQPSSQDIDKFDYYVCGSDQVWRRRYGDVRRYFFDFLKGRDKRRFSYAASFGLDNIDEYSKQEKQDCRELIKSFNSVSVREREAIKIVEQEFSFSAVQVLDPTLLLEKEDYISLIGNTSKQESEDPYLFVYILDKSEQKKELIDIVSRRLNLRVKDIMPKKDWKTSKKDTESVFPAVEEWLDCFDKAGFVLTDSFHGTVFSIIFNKPFLSVGNKDRGLTRFTSLLSLFGLEDRLIFSKKDLTGVLLHNMLKIDYPKINETKSVLKEQSIEFLKQNLDI